MSILLYRVDERLVHGQVVLGWGARLHPDTYVIVDDELAGSEWEQDLYRAGLPEDAGADFLPVFQARERLAEYRADAARGVLLTRDVETMARLGRDGLLRGETVNLGGIYAAPGRTRRIHYVHLSEEEAGALRELEREGVSVEAQDLPGSRQVPLEGLLR